ncbi:DUF4037 domain-containing protein [Streptomyces cylindrosporus]|uniref:DUF4037 domain-containing protein n=1 Tax=Streptomyces cylindrosporus TaxID=2927583 RepID=A0ABS9Y8B0_9ACTN|nr:DUF4037 domain-containing protein [Streptomyces cylindrosporus]MCI3272161.1 DUF4037 domain-containing protein [Streptomyces cylindrosporus]
MSSTNMPAGPPPFLPGLELSRRLYTDVVRPLLEEAAPGVPHSAARLGSGSDVLGYDTPHSAGPSWRPRLQLFLRRHDVHRHAGRIRHVLAAHLPRTFHGHPARDGVEVTHITPWFVATLGFDPSAPGDIGPTDWLATPTQLLAEVTAGAVFHDGLGELAPLRSALRWYPHDIWLHVLACQWRRVAREAPYVTHCGETGDELGSAVAAARVARDLMRLGLLMDRRYPPYGKWLGTAFARTTTGHHLAPVLTAAVTATDRRSREKHLSQAYEATADLHNQLDLTDRVAQDARPERFAAALTARISDPAIKDLPPTGAIDQFVDDPEILTRPPLTRALYREARKPRSE